MIVGIFVFGLISCSNEDENDSLPKPEDGSYTLLVTDHKNLCGLWKLDNISGGHDGNVIIPKEKTYFEIKETSEYSITKNENVLYESGKIQLFKKNNNLFIELIADYYQDGQTHYNPKRGIFLIGSDSLFLNDPCCDSYCYLFLRGK